MNNRAQSIDRFLATTRWSDARRISIAGDASIRKYHRLMHPDGSTAILMDAAPEHGGNVRPFQHIAAHLRQIGLSAPQIFSSDNENGLLVIEDLGDDLFARVIPKSSVLEIPLYQAATDVLVHLHAQPAPADLVPFDAEFMTPLAGLAYSWYLRGADGKWHRSLPVFEAAFRQILHSHVDGPQVLVQRDYHAENLLWLPDRSAQARVGLLDFQDAMLGHPAYDLVSLLQDARRDVPPHIERLMIARYVDSTGCDAAQFDAAYHVLGAQRNLRILGVFSRLSLHFGKPHYVDFMPRVYGLLMRDLRHPALTNVAEMLRHDLPQPTPDVLTKLKAKCATVPTL